MNSPGQLGAPESPHYSDLFERWAEGGAFPLLYGREKVEAAAEWRSNCKHHSINCSTCEIVVHVTEAHNVTWLIMEVAKKLGVSRFP